MAAPNHVHREHRGFRVWIDTGRHEFLRPGSVWANREAAEANGPVDVAAFRAEGFRILEACWNDAGHYSVCDGRDAVRRVVPDLACIVMSCTNRSNEGKFDGPICMPCADVLRGRSSASGVAVAVRILESVTRVLHAQTPR